MALKRTFVLLAYDLSESSSYGEAFRKAMTEIGWVFETGKLHLPRFTCVKEFKGESEAAAHDHALKEVRMIADGIRKSPGCTSFVVERYFFLAHIVPNAEGSVGENL
jgi:hypothetical protein